jgi:hypothetical protein
VLRDLFAGPKRFTDLLPASPASEAPSWQGAFADWSSMASWLLDHLVSGFRQAVESGGTGHERG